MSSPTRNSLIELPGFTTEAPWTILLPLNFPKFLYEDVENAARAST
jgi:hypothetical protein